jgi:hypothetical protein
MVIMVEKGETQFHLLAENYPGQGLEGTLAGGPQFA